MATKTFEELKQLAIQIRDEKTNKQNTATRIGTQMLEHLDKLEQDYYDKTTTNEKFTEIEIGKNVVDNYKLGYYSSSDSSFVKEESGFYKCIEFPVKEGDVIIFINNITSDRFLIFNENQLLERTKIQIGYNEVVIPKNATKVCVNLVFNDGGDITKQYISKKNAYNSLFPLDQISKNVSNIIDTLPPKVDGLSINYNIVDFAKDGYVSQDGNIHTELGVYKYIIFEAKAGDLFLFISDIADNRFLCFNDESFIERISYKKGYNEIIIPERTTKVAVNLIFNDNSSLANKYIARISAKDKLFPLNEINKNINDLFSNSKSIYIPYIQRIFGAYIGADGNLVDSEQRYYTDYIDIIPNCTEIYFYNVKSIADVNNTFAALYDSNDSFIEAIKYTTNSDNVNYKYQVTNPNAKKLRFTCGKSDGICTMVGSIPSNSIYSNKSKVNKIINSINLKTITKNITLSDENGYVDKDGTIATSDSRKYSIKTDVGLGNVLVINHGIAISDANNTIGAFYDEFGNFISSFKAKTLSEDINVEVEIPFSAYTFQCTANENTTYTIQVTDDSIIWSHNYGKTLAVFGGSFSQIEESSIAKDYWKEKLHLKITNYGVGGAGFGNTTGEGTNHIQAQVDRACAAEKPLYDIYLLWASTNDFWNGADYIGEPTDYTEEDSYNVEKLKTQCGGINYCVKKILEKNPNAKILFFTSMRAFSSGAKGYDINYSENDGLNKFVEKQIQCCENWGIPYLNQFKEYFINILNYKQYIGDDNLHPKEKGYEFIRGQQVSFLANS